MPGLLDLLSGMRGLLGPSSRPAPAGLLGSGLTNEDVAQAMEWQQSVMRSAPNQVPYTPRQIEADRVAKWATAAGDTPGQVRHGGLLSMGLTPERYENAMMWGGLSPIGATVFHGSPHRFNKFDMSKIGTGEGAQAYGHGLYFSENRAVADEYARKLSSRNSFAGQPIDQGVRYKVDLPDDQIANMLDWDKPLSQQPESVRKALKGAWKPTSMMRAIGYEPTAGDLLQEIAKKNGWDRNGSEMTAFLKSSGIPGIKYLDAGSRAGGKGTRNYVVFDDQYQIIGRE